MESFKGIMYGKSLIMIKKYIYAKSVTRNLTAGTKLSINRSSRFVQKCKYSQYRKL